MLFDFEYFLSWIDPSQKYEFQSLTGGVVNLTVRATKVLTTGNSFFPKHDTLILKYAPPFVAALGHQRPSLKIARYVCQKFKSSERILLYAKFFS